VIGVDAARAGTGFEKGDDEGIVPGTVEKAETGDVATGAAPAVKGNGG
jgi:hypothetical protein